MENLLTLAQTAVAYGYSVIPPREDGSKRPLGPWETYQRRLPDYGELQQWFPPSRQGIGIVTGKVSGNTEVLDFDNWDIYQAFLARAEEQGLGPVVSRIRAGYEEQTPKPGAHLIWRCTAISGNQKLALSANMITRIETRGEGGFCVLAPSGGMVHQSGRPYKLLQGGWETIRTISEEERTSILALCRSFDQAPPRTEHKPAAAIPTGSTNGTRPGDLFAAATSWTDILEPHGWQWVMRVGEVDHWRRPGKSENTSATTNYAGSDLFYCFSSSTQFDLNRGYGKFSVYSLLNHNGNFDAAVLDLMKKGFVHAIPLNTEYTPAEESPGTPGKDQAVSLIPYHFTDVGNAERLFAWHGTDTHWVQNWNRWATWTPPVWDTNGDLTVIRYAKQTVRALYSEAGELSDLAASDDNDDDRKKQATVAAATLKFALRSEDSKSINSMVSLLKEQVAVLPDAFDNNPWILNCSNGTVDLKTGQIRPHMRGDYLTKLVNVDYNQNASCAQWEDFLDTTFDGNQELISWMQKAVGYTLTGSNQEQVFFLCHGVGSNGKSTFLHILTALTGDYGQDTPFQTFMPKRSETIRNDLAALKGCRFVSAIESNVGDRLSDNVLKSVTGGDKITARFMRGEFFSYYPQFKVWLASNHRPIIKDTTHAMWRRVCLIPFNTTIPDDQQDQNLGEKLMIELPGILAWAVRGCVRWVEEGLKPFPEIVTVAIEAYREESDVVAEFLAEECVLQQELSVSSSTLYAAFCRWSEAQGEKKPMSINAFGASLTEKGFRVERSSLTGKKLRRGIGLKTQEDRES